MEREMVKEHTLTLMETSMKGNGRMGNIMVMGHTLLKMEVLMSGNGRMINTTVKVHGLEKGYGKDKNM